MNRVYGVVGIKSVMASWNSDFSGRPRTTGKGDIFGSDKAFKYPIKKMWESENKGEKVLYIKSYKTDNAGNLQARNLGERFEQLFGKNVKDVKGKKEMLKFLFNAIDVKNFGATFAFKNMNISITGAVQVGQGLNKYADSNIEIMDILSPFIIDEKKENTSIGKKIVSDEAHYFYPFSVNPENYDIYTKEIEDLVGYTREDYEKFKRGCLCAATAYNTNSKMGCENEFALFVECKEGSKLYLANLDQYIKFVKQEEGKDIIDISELNEILSQESIATQIEKVEVYYNPYTIDLLGANEKYILKELF